MSYAKSVGLNIGSKIKVLSIEGGCSCFDVGDVIVLVRDDGSRNTWFVLEGSQDENLFFLFRYEWEHYKEVEGVDNNPWLEWGGSSKAPVEEGTKVDIKYFDGTVATGIGSQDSSEVPDCDYTCSSWYRNPHDPADGSIIAWRLHRPVQEEKKEVLEQPLVSIKQEVKYAITIKGVDFTFTQEELDSLAEELLGFTTL